MASTDPFGARGTFDTGNGEAGIYRISKLQEQGCWRYFKIAILDSSLVGIGFAKLR